MSEGHNFPRPVALRCLTENTDTDTAFRMCWNKVYEVMAGCAML